MCIGIPMQVIRADFGFALCEGMGVTREVDTLLVGTPAPGDWVLVFMNSARELVSPDEARRITDALHAVEQVMSVQPHAPHPTSSEIDTLFADLAGREPPKPPSLLALEAQRKNQGDQENS